MKKIKKELLPPLSILQTRHVEKPYNTIVETYHKKHFHEEIFDPLLDSFVEFIGKKASVLDIGCGTGGETVRLLQQGLSVISIDIADGMLQKAREAVPQGDFRKMDLLNLKFDNDTFDGIWSARTLIHIPSDQQGVALKEITRVLKPGGIVCLTVLGGDQEAIEPEYYDITGRTTTFFKFFAENELADRLQKHGFTIIEQKVTYRDGENEPHITVFARKEA